MDGLNKFALTIQNPALDVIIIGCIVVAGFLLGTLGGKSKLLSFLFATYLTLLFFPVRF